MYMVLYICILKCLTRHVREVHHHVGVFVVREVNGPPGVQEVLEVRVAVCDDGRPLPRHHAHVAHQLSVQLDLFPETQSMTKKSVAQGSKLNL